jgi:hypothetical protein
MCSRNRVAFGLTCTRQKDIQVNTSVPLQAYITGLPQDVLNSPMGPMLVQMLQPALQNQLGNATASGIATPGVQPTATPAPVAPTTSAAPQTNGTVHRAFCPLTGRLCPCPCSATHIVGALGIGPVGSALCIPCRCFSVHLSAPKLHIYDRGCCLARNA